MSFDINSPPFSLAGKDLGETSINVALLSPTQRGLMRALFTKMFGHPMSESMWEWKYGNGRGLSLVGTAGSSDVVAHYGGFPRRIAFGRDELPSIQAGDVMVDASARVGLSRRGALCRITETFLSSCVGDNRPYCLAFGFPNERHFRLIERLGLYEGVDRIMEFSLLPGNIPSLLWKVAPITVFDDLVLSELNRLWVTMRSALPEYMLPVRDGFYLRQRYLLHPDGYQVYLARHRLSGRIKALWVLADRGSWIELLDVVASPDRLPAVLDCVWAIAQTKKKAVRGWLTESAIRRWPSQRLHINPTDVRVAQSIWPNGNALAASTRGHWWLMGGDTDFH